MQACLGPGRNRDRDPLWLAAFMIGHADMRKQFQLLDVDCVIGVHNRNVQGKERETTKSYRRFGWLAAEGILRKNLVYIAFDFP